MTEIAPRKAIDLKAVRAVVEKEFLDNLRNRWIIAVSLLFIVFTLIISYFGTAQSTSETGFQGLAQTAQGMIAISLIFVSILGLMLGYATIVAEREQGSLLLFLSMPITRLEIVLGKFLGLGSVMLVTIVTGLGIGGIVIIAAVGADDALAYLWFVLGTALLALAFLSVGMFISTVMKRRSTALGLSIFMWVFFAFLFNLLLLGIFVATGGSFGSLDVAPDWLYVALLLNPTNAFSTFGQLVFGLEGGFGGNTPGFVNTGTAALSLLLWTVVPLLLAFWRFQKQDI